MRMTVEQLAQTIQREAEQGRTDTAARVIDILECLSTWECFRNADKPCRHRWTDRELWCPVCKAEDFLGEPD